MKSPPSSASSFDGSGYLRLSPHELTATDRRRRLIRLGVARRTAAVLGGRIPLNWMLARALPRLERKDRGFAVPTPLATSCLGKNLLLAYPPAEIDSFLADWVLDGKRRLHTSDNFLGAGDWRPISGAIMDSPVAREAAELNACTLDYRATSAYVEMVRAAEGGKAIRRQQVLLDRRELIDDYFQRFVTLFRSIREHGVLPYHMLRQRGTAEPGERDVGVAIGCGGEIYRLRGGQHRTAIAKVLGLPAMPVEVRLVHAGWLGKIRDETGVPPARAICEGIWRIANSSR